MRSVEPAIMDYFAEAPSLLQDSLLKAPVALQVEILRALEDLRAEAGPTVLSLLARPGFQHAEQAIRVLRWSRDPRAGAWLRDFAVRHGTDDGAPRRFRPVGKSGPTGSAYRAALTALRNHPSAETESILGRAARIGEPASRVAALGSLGWWEVRGPGPVLEALQLGRRDGSPAVRQSARAALARLGERQAIHGFRLALHSEDPGRVHETIQAIASEGLTILWPELDSLADSDDSDIAQLARAALEQLREDMESRQA
jgi:HEAT repeat protein